MGEQAWKQKDCERKNPRATNPEAVIEKLRQNIDRGQAAKKVAVVPQIPKQ